MRRWIIKAGATDLDGLVLEDAATPEPGPGEVRVRMRAASLNYRDQLILKGAFGRTPVRDMVPVSDGAGEIDALGAGVTEWAVGDRVASLYFDWQGGPVRAGLGTGLGSDAEDGVLAEYVVLPARRVVRAPETLDFAQSAALPCAALTAWNALFHDHSISAGSTVLVLGTGGVSLFALLLARAAGARVLATTGQDSKRQRLLALGASEVFNYKTDPDWGKTIFAETGGVEKVVDAAGTLNDSLEAVGYGGEVVLMGLITHSDAPPPAALMMSRNAIIRATSVGSAEMFKSMSKMIDAHQLKPPISHRFGFEDAPDAYNAQTSSDLFGKVVIHIT